MSQLRAIVERIERLHEEKKALEEDIREVYAEAKANGFDTKVLRQVVKARGQDPNARSEAEEIFDLYWSEIHGPRVHTRDAREAVDPKLVATIANGMQTDIGRKALGMALDVMIDAETGEITEQPETANETAGPSSSLSGNDGSNTPVAKPMEARHEVAIETPPHTETQIVSGPSGAEPEATCEPSRHHSQPLRKTAADYRTHCLHPEQCGASGLDHCFSCRQSMAEQRVPA